jgi:putative ABC transport system permease protein
LNLNYEPDEENIEQLPKTIVIGDTVNTRLKGLDTVTASSLYLIYPDYMAQNVQSYTIAFDAKDYDAMIKGVESWRKSNNISEDSIENTMETKKILESTRGITRLTSNGFIVLVIMIAMANVFNTITANILTRKRDFAVLKSTGMSDKVINKMLVYECITYGTKSVIYGMILAGMSVSSLAWVIYEEKSA